MSLLYEQILVDSLGKPAFVGPYDQIQLRQAPPANVLLLVSNQWTNGVGLHNDQTVITDPSGTTLVETEPIEFFLKDPSAKHRIDARIGFTLQSDGRYRITVRGNGRVVLEYFFHVRFRAPTTDEGT